MFPHAVPPRGCAHTSTELARAAPGSRVPVPTDTHRATHRLARGRREGDAQPDPGAARPKGRCGRSPALVYVTAGCSRSQRQTGARATAASSHSTTGRAPPRFLSAGCWCLWARSGSLGACTSARDCEHSPGEQRAEGAVLILASLIRAGEQSVEPGAGVEQAV